MGRSVGARACAGQPVPVLIRSKGHSIASTTFGKEPTCSIAEVVFFAAVHCCACCRTESSKKKPPIYKVMLHNDNYNRREYVVKILLKTVEGLTVDDAVNVMQVKLGSDRSVQPAVGRCLGAAEPCAKQCCV